MECTKPGTERFPTPKVGGGNPYDLNSLVWSEGRNGGWAQQRDNGWSVSKINENQGQRRNGVAFHPHPPLHRFPYPISWSEFIFNQCLRGKSKRPKQQRADHREKGKFRLIFKELLGWYFLWSCIIGTKGKADYANVATSYKKISNPPKDRLVGIGQMGENTPPQKEESICPMLWPDRRFMLFYVAPSRSKLDSWIPYMGG